MEEVILRNGKILGGDGGLLRDKTIRLLSEQVEKLTRELDQVQRDIGS